MRKKIIQFILVLIIVVAAIAGWKAYSEYRLMTSPWGTDSDAFTIDIEEGKNAHQIAEILVEKKVLRDTNMFLITADLRGLGQKLRAGEYQIKGTQSPYDILDMLATGKQYYHPLVIPEGFTQLDIAQRCAETLVCSATDFLNQCREVSLFSFVIAQAPGGANAAVEGVLYPDTYYLFKNTPAIKVVDRMSKRFEDIIKALYDEALAKSKERGTPWWWESVSASFDVQVHRITVLASIVEKEAKRPEDRPMIASVFVNRIKKQMPLQADSTIHYAINDWSRPLTSEDLKVDSAYNTYTNPGLPPAAICNPGKDCLEAALKPADSNNLFFIAMNDGQTKFTASYDEFLTWKNQLKSERKAEGKAETVPETVAPQAVAPATGGN
jgi:UPF0755 protein